MNPKEILAELPKLSPDELQIVQNRIMELQEAQELEPSSGLNAAIEEGMKLLKDEPVSSLKDLLLACPSSFEIPAREKDDTRSPSF